VTIYALEPEVPLGLFVRGVTAGSAGKGTTEGSGHAGGRAIVPNDMYGEMMHTRAQTLQSLTERTGGKWARGVMTIDDVFRTVGSDLSLYYSLAYRATGMHDQPRRIE